MRHAFWQQQPGFRLWLCFQFRWRQGQVALRTERIKGEGPVTATGPSSRFMANGVGWSWVFRGLAGAPHALGLSASVEITAWEVVTAYVPSFESRRVAFGVVT